MKKWTMSHGVSSHVFLSRPHLAPLPFLQDITLHEIFWEGEREEICEQ